MPDLVRYRAFSDEQPDGPGALYDLVRRGRPSWHKDALCQEDHPGVSWFPSRGQDHRAAVRLCQQCLVLWPCREWAMAAGPDLRGIFGGTTEADRRKLRADVEATRVSPGGRPRPRAHPLATIG